MGRNHNPLTGTQLNKSKFERLTTQIKGYGIRKLASYGLVSHTTITRFCNKLAVGEGTEDKIRESIRQHLAKLEEERKRSVEESEKVLAD